MKTFPWYVLWAEKILIYSLGLLPLFFVKQSLYPFISPKSYLVLSAGLISIGFLVTAWIKNSSWKPNVTIPFGILMAYMIWMIFASLLGKDFQMSWWGDFRMGSGLVMQLGMIVYAFSFLWILQKVDIEKKIAKALMLGGLGLSLYTYADVLFPGSAFLASQAYGGTLGNSSFAGAYLLVSIAAAAWLVSRERTKWKMISIVSLVLIICSPIFFSFIKGFGVGEARGAFLGGIIGCGAAVLLWLSFSKKKTVRTFSAIGMAASVLVGFFCAVQLYTPGTFIHSKFGEAASNSRFVYGSIALQGASDHPVVGWGWGHYPLVYQTYFNPINLTTKGQGDRYATEGLADKPHNILLEILVAGGIPALALYLAFFATILIYASRLIRLEKIDRTTGSIFFGYFIAYFFQNLFLFDTPAVQTTFFVMVAWMMSYQAGRQEKEKRGIIQPSITDSRIRMAVIVSVWMAVSVGMILYAVRPLHEAITVSKIFNSNPEQRAYRLTDSFNITPQGYMYDESEAINGYAREYLSSSSGLSLEQKQQAERELSVYDVFLSNRNIQGPEYSRAYLAKSYELMARFTLSGYQDHSLLDSARSSALRAIQLSPQSPFGYWGYAQSSMFAGDIRSAIAFAEMAVQLNPHVLDSHKVLLGILQFTGNNSVFASAYTRAHALFPNEQFPAPGVYKNN